MEENRITKEMQKELISQFDKSFPQYRNKFEIKENKDGMWTVKLHDYEEKTDLNLLWGTDTENANDTDGLHFKELDIFWLNSHLYFQQLIASYERMHLEDSLAAIRLQIKKNLQHLSEKTELDMNTLWLSITQEMQELEQELKKEYGGNY